MKKLLVKAEIVTQAYQAPVEGVEAVQAQPEKWVKGDEVLFEEPMIEVNLGEFETDPSYTYYPAVEAVEGVEGKPGIPEVKEVQIIAQTQGTDEELEVWLEGDKHKYPEGYWVEYVDMTYFHEQSKINQEALDYLAKTDWMQIRASETGIAMPEEVKALRQAAREKIVHL